tara:strand:+ start:33 stop:227 length:195 start_codon:yes stop_codon:yes gene_type:complete
VTVTKKLSITQIRSGVGKKFKHRRTLRALGFKKHQQTVVKNDNPAIRGMVRQVRYLINVTEVDG